MSATTSAPLVAPSRLLRPRWRGGARTASDDELRAEVVGDQLLRFLGIAGLRYRERPTQLTGGWETFTYSLEFERHPALPALFQGPLVLRIYATKQGAPRARHEFRVQGFLHGEGFPAPRPLLLVEDDEPFGGPFVLMERLPGRSLLEELQARPWKLWNLSAEMA